MSASDFSRVRRLFEAAMNLPVSQQEAFVERFCVDDPELRDEVLGLLESDREMDSARQLLDEGGVKRSPAVATPEQIGPYRAVSVIASGGMGMVYEGIQASPRRRVAIKTLITGPRDKRVLKRFQSEIDVLARLEHPSIARIYSAGTYDQELGDEKRELPYYVMEYIEGAMSITEYAERHKLTIRQRLQLFSEVCEAVDFAHKQGVVHRDLKPGNILIGVDGRPKVIDFGTARLIEVDGVRDGGMTRSGEIIGTLNYMSPEQLSPSEDSPPDARSDVYSLGCVFYELLVGKVAHAAKGQTFAEMVASVLFGTVEPLSYWNPDLSNVLDLVCAKAMNKKRERRYESAAELGLDVQRFLEARQVKAAPPSLGMKLRLFMRRQPAIVAAVFVFLLANGTGVYFMRRAKAKQADLEVLAQQAWSEARESEYRSQSRRGSLATVLNSLAMGTMERAEIAEALRNVDPMASVADVERLVLKASREEVAGELAQQLKLPELAEEHYSSALELWREARGDGDVSVLRLRLAQLFLEHEQGCGDGFRARLNALSVDLKGEHPELAALRYRVDFLGCCLLFDEGERESAEAKAWLLFQQQEGLLGENHVETLDTVWLFARILMWGERDLAAVQYLQRVRDGFFSELGALHPKTLESQVDLAVSMLHVNCAYGEKYLISADEKLGLILGESHPSTLCARVHTLSLLAGPGMTLDLQDEVRWTYASCLETLGLEHSLTKLCSQVMRRF